MRATIIKKGLESSATNFLLLSAYLLTTIYFFINVVYFAALKQAGTIRYLIHFSVMMSTDRSILPSELKRAQQKIFIYQQRYLLYIRYVIDAVCLLISYCFHVAQPIVACNKSAINGKIHYLFQGEWHSIFF